HDLDGRSPALDQALTRTRVDLAGKSGNGLAHGPVPVGASSTSTSRSMWAAAPARNSGHQGRPERG
ncbi:hypothetical protein, partial [Nonomuraea basaltis]|uniref:hypothetical protein n=1 Tax=Nonomuraea basaltis TaxID=2495887 RepID=UPI00197DBBDA